MKKHRFTYFLFAAILVACGETEKNKLDIPEEDVKKKSIVDYNIPSPSEQFSIYASLDVQKDNSFLHDLKKLKDYNTQAKKVSNFGVYVADLGYLTSFNEASMYVNYFTELEKMGKQIGISQVFSEELKNKVKRFEKTPDSLFTLSNDLYNETFLQLIENGKGDELSLILIGGWVESSYLMLSSVESFDKNPLVDQFLADQKPVLENLISFVSIYNSNSDVKKYLIGLTKIENQALHPFQRKKEK
jgi:hypothetical protein